MAVRLLIAPAGLFVAGVAWIVARGAFPADPDYAYLMSGLAVADGSAVAYLDHPGLTVTFLIAAAIRLVGSMDSVLGHPEAWLAWLAIMITLASSAALWWLGSSMLEYGSGAALTTQCLIFASVPVMTQSLARTTPEGLLLPLGLALTAILAGVPTWRRAIGTGVLVALCLATKASAAPLVLLAFAWPTLPLQAMALSAAAVTLLAVTWPVHGQIDRVTASLSAIATHTGDHGHGAVGIIPPEYWQTVHDLAVQNPLAVLAIAACPFGGRLAIIGGLTCAVQIAIVAKHPGVAYLVPMCPVVCLVHGVVLGRLGRHLAIAERYFAIRDRVARHRLA